MRNAVRLVLGIVLAAWHANGNSGALAQGKKSPGPAYDVVRLVYPGSAQRSTWAYDLNDLGNVVGDYDDAAGLFHGYFYNAATNTYQSLGTDVVPYGLNNLDEIVGRDNVGGVGLYWSSPGAAPADLPPLAGHTHSQARAINAAGIIIGTSYIPEDAPVTPGFFAAVAWHVDSLGVVHGPVELPFLAGHIAGSAQGLTETIGGFTAVVGESGFADSTVPVSWSVALAGGELTVAGPSPFGGTYFVGTPWNTNNLGDTVGRAAFVPGAAGKPFLKRAGQSVTPLPMLSNAYSGSATDINDAGRIVGGQGVTINRQGTISRAVLWTSPATVVDLNSLVSLGKGESLTWSLRINGAGDILAFVNGGIPCLLVPK